MSQKCFDQQPKPATLQDKGSLIVISELFTIAFYSLF